MVNSSPTNQESIPVTASVNGCLSTAFDQHVVRESTRKPQITVPEQSSRIPSIDARGRVSGSLLRTARPVLYILLILAVALGAGAYSLRKYGIFSCQASGYGTDGYLGYCGATSYGDYDHGAIWFGFEPAASTAASNAQVLFLGNSRTQFAFSSKATADWFSALSQSYYLLGFSHFENYTFEAPLLSKLHPKARVYVINIDTFFEPSETGPGKTVMRDELARTHYEEKRQWQWIHKAVCTTSRAVCGNDEAIFRLRSTGSWLVTGDRFTSEPVSYDETIDQNRVASFVARGGEFLPSLSDDRICTILTIVPTVNTSIGTARAIAAALGLNLVAPMPGGLVTFDGVHLDRKSAQRWSTTFFEEAGPKIRSCLSDFPDSHVAMRGTSVMNP